MLKWTVPSSPQSDDAEVWMPQGDMHSAHHRSMPPDVVINYSDGNEFSWNTMPQAGKRRPSRDIRPGSPDSGVSVSSNRKEYIQLTKTVKESLIVSAVESKSPTNGSTLNRNPTVSPQRAHILPTYRMPPLTPTVATLISTATVPFRKQRKARSPQKRESKILTPVATSPDKSHLISNGTASLRRIRSNVQKEHKYDSLQFNRGSVMKDSKTLTTDYQGLSDVKARHSWNSDHEECSTNFGRGSIHDETQPNLASPSPTSSEHNSTVNDPGSLSDFKPTSSALTPMPAPTPGTNLQRRKSKSKRGDSMPPPPPRRAPTTKLSASGENLHTATPPRKSSLSPNGLILEENPRANMQRHMSLPLVEHPSRSNPTGHKNSPGERRSPQVSTPTRNHQEHLNPNSVHLPPPVPPPSDSLPYDTLNNNGSRVKKQNGTIYGLPSPPPTL